MVMPNIPVPKYPDVLKLPGVPPLLRQTGVRVLDQIFVVQADAANMPEKSPAQVWGVFDPSGVPVVTPDTILGFALREESRISDYPQEAGAFSSYNKAEVPFDARVQMAKGGTTDERSLFLKSVKSAKDSLTLFSVITPEVTYESANIVHYDYRRETHNGAGMIVVDIWLREVRVTGKAVYSNTKNPQSAPPADTGAVQPIDADFLAAYSAANPQPPQ